jgi:hypothetical protein
MNLEKIWNHGFFCGAAVGFVMGLLIGIIIFIAI